MPKAIPKPTVERLVSLSRLLEEIEKSFGFDKETSCVSSMELAELTGWKADTIRRDISLLGSDSATATGYNVSLLKVAIVDTLQLNTTVKKCCIVGLGRLGSALVEYEGFADSPFSIVAGFDTNVNRTETLRSPFPLYTTPNMARIIAQERIELALLAVPAHAAQESAEKLASCGIKGIVNFTATVIRVPKEVRVEHISVLDALQKIAVKSALDI